MVEGDEQHVSGELSKVEEADISGTNSTSTGGTTSTSPDGYIVKLEQVEERVHESEASHNADSKHLRPLICTEEADGFHKRVKRIHDPVKFVVPCAVFEVESPIPPDRSVCLGSYSGVFDDHIHPEASQRGLIFRSEVDTDTTELVSNDINTPRSIDTTTSPSIDTTAASSIDCGRISE
ncbi:hypothetical protein F2Q68_00009919 [Brassica cretica]|uniref:Uncharacterized protein n=1 Tax=Brassica cretica TaxID=69181 RepID=A0A8S9KSI7_BRACR|nr:hypothetical protein F2Q68_00009919 [Brassica cretica]